MADKIRIKNKYDVQDNYEPSDSENEFSPTDKKLLEKVRKRRHKESESDEEMFAFSESEAESDGKNDLMADSDVEGQENSEDDLPDSRAWGKKKKSYYSTDYVDEDYGGFGENEERAALMEEEEAKNIQKRLLQQLGEDDFSLEFFTSKKTDDQEKEVIIKSDLSQLSKRQKLQLLEKESPEFSGLVDDFKTKLTVAKDDLLPVIKLIKDGTLPECPAAKFVKTNYDLILNYCTNISFYLMLKAKRISIQNHPVVKRLYQYRQMLNQMEPIFLEVVKPQIDSIMLAIKNNIALVITEEKDKKRKSAATPEGISKKLKLISTFDKEDAKDTGVSDDDDDDSEDKNDGDDYFNFENKVDKTDTKIGSESEESGFSDAEDGVNGHEDEIKDSEDNPDSKITSTSQEIYPHVEDQIGKRKITYQIAKNKGLTPHRKKDQRNPRVKHKLKYRKAKIRRKGAVREARTEISKYSGEASGIKSNVKKSIKIK